MIIHARKERALQKLFVVSHTHWDREWYEPFQVYRARLIRCVDKLRALFAADPDYKYFLLDGQTIILEDYLEVRPDCAQALRDLVGAGKLQIGPWYVLPDEFLVSGEAMIRNLLRGLDITRDFGGTMTVGYIPDPFGHISQMPQILQGFGIDTAVFRRGLADEPTELWWQAPNGSRVLACYLRDGYDNAAWLGHDTATFIRQLEKQWRSLAPHTVTANVLLLNGNDHMEPWHDLSHLLRVAREQLATVEIIHASLPMYVAQTQKEIADRNIELAVVSGELRNPKRHHVLPGVASARMWIKQRNVHAQMLLEKWGEPFAAFAELETGKGGSEARSNRQLTQTAWKYLLQNHPHDSICGCGADQTHAEMAIRFDWVEQIVEPLITENLLQLAEAIDTRAAGKAVPLVVFNPAAGPRTDCVAAQIELPAEWEAIVITDAAGNVMPSQVQGRRVKEYYHKRAQGKTLGGILGMVQAGRIRGMAIHAMAIAADVNPIRMEIVLKMYGESDPDQIDNWQRQFRQVIDANPDTFFDIRGHSPVQLDVEFVAHELPGHGYKAFFAAPANASTAATRAKALIVENEFYRVEPNQGNDALTVTDKLTGTVYRGVNRFVDGGDRGDLYNYCPPENDSLVDQPSAPPQVTSEKNSARQSLRIALNYSLPKELSADRTGRAAETVDAEISTTVSLYPGVRRIDFQTRVKNPARDHRLQVEFPTPIVSPWVAAEQAFDIVQRPLDLPQNTTDWIEQPRPEAPMQNFVAVSDGKLGLTLATRGLPEYQAQRDAEGTKLALTLLRCVGWLSRDDLTTRLGHAGPALATPGAQEIGSHTFEYALIAAEGDWRETFAGAQAFGAPLRALTTSAHSGGLPSAASFIAATPPAFVISAIKQSEDGQRLIVRGYNRSEQPISVRLEFLHRFASATRVNLREQDIAPLELRDGREITLTAHGKEIVSIAFYA